jgi:hypothetical protein
MRWPRYSNAETKQQQDKEARRVRDAPTLAPVRQLLPLRQAAKAAEEAKTQRAEEAAAAAAVAPGEEEEALWQGASSSTAAAGVGRS